jgi:hypothetical protein
VASLSTASHAGAKEMLVLEREASQRRVCRQTQRRVCWDAHRAELTRGGCLCVGGEPDR